jgi:hypothetical protein
MPGPFFPPPFTPPYSDQQRAYLRKYMGYSKLFKSSNAIFENILDLIQSVPAYDDGSTFNETIWILNKLVGVEELILNNTGLGLATSAYQAADFDAVRNDRHLRHIGRAYIRQFSIIFSMKPAHDYFSSVAPDLSGNIMPPDYGYDTD